MEAPVRRGKTFAIIRGIILGHHDYHNQWFLLRLDFKRNFRLWIVHLEMPTCTSPLYSPTFKHSFFPTNVLYSLPLPLNHGSVLSLIRILDSPLSAHHPTSLMPTLLEIEDVLIKQTSAWLGLPRSWSTSSEQFFNLLERLSCGFGVCEESLDSCAEAECSEDDEEFPRDILECGRYEETDCEVEEPVSRSVRSLLQTNKMEEQGVKNLPVCH